MTSLHYPRGKKIVYVALFTYLTKLQSIQLQKRLLPGFPERPAGYGLPDVVQHSEGRIRPQCRSVAVVHLQADAHVLQLVRYRRGAGRLSVCPQTGRPSGTVFASSPEHVVGEETLLFVDLSAHFDSRTYDYLRQKCFQCTCKTSCFTSNFNMYVFQRIYSNKTNISETKTKCYDVSLLPLLL